MLPFTAFWQYHTSTPCSLVLSYVRKHPPAVPPASRLLPYPPCPALPYNINTDTIQTIPHNTTNTIQYIPFRPHSYFSYSPTTPATPSISSIQPRPAGCFVMQSTTSQISQIETQLSPIGYRNSSCGYCRNKSGSFSYYMHAISLAPGFYQKLLDRGWRRSGTTLYKPDQRASCCPQYTIRLDSKAFRPSKDQRQVQNRYNRHVLGHSYTTAAARLFPRSREQARKRNTDFDLLERVHESERAQLRSPPEPAHRFDVTLESDAFTEEKYVVFENYQRLVHRELPRRISRRGFENFLCDSPIKRSKEVIDGRQRLLGSYHQCYRLDGKLVAIGVLDLLPQCVSAVYFMYHGSVQDYAFGKLGALREIALANEEDYRWWYAGFYIHSCVKMRYKGTYHPQYILDPECYVWDLLDKDVEAKLDEKKYLSLSRETTGKRNGGGTEASRSLPKSASTYLGLPPGTQHDDDSDDNDPHASDLPLFMRNIPGIMTKDELLQDPEFIGNTKLKIGRTMAHMRDLVDWESSDLDDADSIKGIVGALVAAVGPECSREMVVVLGE